MNKKALVEMKHACISFSCIWLIVPSGLIELNMPTRTVVANVNISLQVLKSAREKLKNAQLIAFVVGGRFRVKTKYQILAPSSTPKHSPYSNIKTKEKNVNTNTYGKKKGFIHSGSDFD